MSSAVALSERPSGRRSRRIAPEVLFVINGLGTGGAERSLAELLPVLRQEGIGSSVICLYPRTEGVERLVRGTGVRVHILPSNSLVGKARDLRKIVGVTQPDVLHTTIFEADQLGRIAAWGTATRVLTSLVSMPYSSWRTLDPNVTRWRLEAARMCDGWTARHLTDHFHAVTNSVKKAAVRTLGIRPERVTVIERGRDRCRLGSPSLARRIQVRKRLRLGQDDQVLLNVGRHEFAKGQVDLLQAMPTLLRTHPHAQLLIAGRSGNNSAELSRIAAELGLGSRVQLLGHREDVPDLMAAADVFVFPSLYEGLGGVLIEAMALRLPIVASDLESIREIIQEGVNADLVPVRSPDPLASAISALLSDGDRRAHYAEQGQRIFERRFRLERSTTAMASLIRRVAEKPLLQRERES